MVNYFILLLDKFIFPCYFVGGNCQRVWQFVTKEKKVSFRNTILISFAVCMIGGNAAYACPAFDQAKQVKAQEHIDFLKVQAGNCALIPKVVQETDIYYRLLRAAQKDKTCGTLTNVDPRNSAQFGLELQAQCQLQNDQKAAK